MTKKTDNNNYLNKRFRGFLPVIIDIETAGFNPDSDAMLEIAFIFIEPCHDNPQNIAVKDNLHFHIEPFLGANLDHDALEFTGIDPHHPFRFATKEKDALSQAFTKISEEVKLYKCSRAVLVAHNPIFDLSFLLAAIKRCKLTKENPFHKFTTLDTATMGAMLYKQTVLSRAVRAAGISFDQNQAHGALYDATKTAELFCNIINKCNKIIA